MSPEVRDVLCSFDAEAIELCEIDWEYNDESMEPLQAMYAKRDPSKADLHDYSELVVQIQSAPGGGEGA